MTAIKISALCPPSSRIHSPHRFGRGIVIVGSVCVHLAAGAVRSSAFQDIFCCPADSDPRVKGASALVSRSEFIVFEAHNCVVNFLVVVLPITGYELLEYHDMSRLAFSPTLRLESRPAAVAIHHQEGCCHHSSIGYEPGGTGEIDHTVAIWDSPLALRHKGGCVVATDKIPSSTKMIIRGFISHCANSSHTYQKQTKWKRGIDQKQNGHEIGG